MHFSWNWTYLENDQINLSILAGLGQLITPLFTPLGFGSQLTNLGWVFVVAAISGLIAKENVVGAMGTLAASIVAGFTPPGGEAIEGLAAVEAMIEATGIGAPGLLAFIAFNMLTIPCFAAVATARAELTKPKFKGTIVFWLVISYVVSSAIYLIGTFWWSVFIFIALIALMILAIKFYNKYKDQKKLGSS